MDKLVNYRLDEFYTESVELVKEYIAYLAYLPAKQTEKEVFYMSLRDVQAIRDYFLSGTLDDTKEIVKLVQGLDDRAVMKMKIIDFFGYVNSAREQIEIIAKAEESSLIGKAYNQKWEAVNGSERLQKFGIYNVLDKLAGGDILKYEKILDITYADIFTKLYRDTELGDIEYEMSKIKSLNP